MSSAGGRGEIEAAKRSLSTAKKWEASTAERLKDAEQQVSAAKNEADSAREQVKEAEKYLLSVEKKWEVIDVDIDSEDGTPKKKRQKKQNNENTGQVAARGDRGLNPASSVQISSSGVDQSAGGSNGRRERGNLTETRTSTIITSLHPRCRIDNSSSDEELGGDLPSIDAVRIAVGKKVFKSKCKLSFQFGTKEPYILFSYIDGKGNKCKHYVHLNDGDLKEVNYFVESDDDSLGDDADESMTVMSFRIAPTEKNGFDKYSSAYHQDDSEDEGKTERRYISVEFRDTDDFQAMLEQMRQHPALEVWCGDDAKILPSDLPKYTQALLDDSRKVLLVYPFAVDEAILTEADSELTELGGDLLGVEGAQEGAYNGITQFLDEETEYITIRQSDRDRLRPGQFLNDTLVDFWMRWISRGESSLPDSKVHFFATHFMTTLKEDGPDAVASLTANINVFDKKLIFLPVSADSHRSLCVIVNPGLIANNYDDDIADDEEHACILFLDSLKMHRKKTYAKHIRKWLNFEWKRLGKGKVEGADTPFYENGMVLCAPKIPYQEYGCDCGVFVCRYAYNLYTMRHQKFTFKGVCERPKFLSLITRGAAFQFDMADIARIREEIGVLIDHLSKHYLLLKE